MTEYLTFKSFYSEEEAVEFARILSEREVPNRIEKSRPLVDKVFGGDDLAKEFHVRIYPENFIKANGILDSLITENISSVEEDHYLYSFDNNELLDVLHKADEWSNQDVILSRKILKERGVDISDNEIAAIKSERYTQLAKPEKAQTNRIFRGYIYAVFFAPVGIISGLIYLNTKTILPDGKKINAFDEETRHHAKNFILIGSIIIVLGVIDALFSHLLF